MNEISLSAVIKPDVLARAQMLDADAFADRGPIGRMGQSVRRIRAIDQARADLGMTARESLTFLGVVLADAAELGDV